MIDLDLYVRLVDWFDELELSGEFMGGGEAVFKWFFDHEAMERSVELAYLLAGAARLMGHPKGLEWDEFDRRPDLDAILWTFHRVWIDRYGWESTMQAGRVRRERQSEAMRPT